MAGQNLGAGHPDRVVRSTHITASLGLGLAGLVGTAFIVIPEPLLALFGMTEDTVVTLGRELLRYLAISGLFVTVAMTYTGALQGTGDTRGPFYISIVSQLIVPVGLCTVLQAMRGLESTDIWLAIVLGHMTRCLLSILRFRQGHWRRIAVDIGSA
jgi:Na+-driven multidrug efflux pump